MNQNNQNIKFIDLFAGIGGIRLGFEKENYKCVFSSEIDKECQKTYFLNFKEYPQGDITKISTSEIPKFDVLTAGFPCQPFSICGKQKGFNDTRGTLFYEILRIIKSKKPEVVFLENVKHLMYHDSGSTLKIILKSLDELGYKISWDIVNAKDFGLAQNRERIIIIGHPRKKFDFSMLQQKNNLKIKDIIDKEGDYEYLEKNEYTLLDKLTHQKKSGLIFAGYRNKKIRKNGVRPDTLHLSRVHKQPNRIYSAEGTHPTLPSQESSGRFFILINNKVRKLTTLECFRLMGFPDSFKKYSSNGNLYRQIGNSVAVPMIKKLARQIRNQFFKK